MVVNEEPVAITNIARANGVLLTQNQQTLLSLYVEQLLTWNAKVNLISRRDEENVWESHILHSLSVLFFVRPPERGRMLDLGTGGGLPGLPLAILRPDIELLLVDATAKKVRAVEDMITRLGIHNVRAVWSRAEDLATMKGISGSFDVVVARAVAPLSDLVRWARPLLKGGPALSDPLQSFAGRNLPHEISSPYLLCMKGGDLEGEIQKAKVKTGITDILVLDLVINGGPFPSLEGKKIVVIRP